MESLELWFLDVDGARFGVAGVDEGTLAAARKTATLAPQRTVRVTLGVTDQDADRLVRSVGRVVPLVDRGGEPAARVRIDKVDTSFNLVEGALVS